MVPISAGWRVQGNDQTGRELAGGEIHVLAAVGGAQLADATPGRLGGGKFVPGRGAGRGNSCLSCSRQTARDARQGGGESGFRSYGLGAGLAPGTATRGPRSHILRISEYSRRNRPSSAARPDSPIRGRE